ncbi:MAG: serine hydrolase [Flavobacteriaceae bacterium]
MKTFRYHLLAIFFVFFVSFIQAQINYFPERHTIWEEKSASDFGINTVQLKTAIDFVKTNEYSGSRDLRIAILEGFAREPFHQILGPTKKREGPAGLILKDGFVIAKWGDTKRVDMAFSVTKSFLSTIAGLAVDKGLIRNETDYAKDYLWDGTFDGEHNSKITFQHLLQQNSDWSGELWGGKDWADRPPREGGLDDWKNRKLKEPGTFMEYNDVRVNVLAYALLQIWRKPLPQVLKDEVMDKIGASTTWQWFGYENAWTTIDGLQMKSVTGGGHSGGGLFISAEDMARFGLLFLNDGKWKNEQIISKNWIERAVTSSKPNINYGYMWWLNKKGARHWENVSEDIYYAAGFGGNFIIVDEKHNIVVVTRWLEPSKIGEFMQTLTKALD